MLMLIITICKRHTWRMQAMAFTQRTINIRTPWHNDTHFLIDKTHTYKTNVCTNTDWDKNTNNVRMSIDLQDITAIFTKPQIGKTHVFFFLTKSTLTFFLTNPKRSYLKHTNRIYMWQIPIGSTWQIPIDSNRQIRIDSIWQIPMITIVSLFWLHPLALHCDQIILSGGGYSLLTEISTNVIMVNDKMILLYFWMEKIVKSYT